MNKNLETDFLLSAYASGYFPMPEPHTEEIKWYFPEPRAILPLEGFHCSRTLSRTLRRGEYQVSYDKNFVGVMKACAARKDTWINKEFIKAYTKLHELGFAHSVEVWCEKTLVGGLYGVSIGGAFFAESKFHEKTDASKVALYFLVQELKKRGFGLLEVQFLTPHLKSLGVIEVSSIEYLKILKKRVIESQKWGDNSLRLEPKK